MRRARMKYRTWTMVFFVAAGLLAGCRRRPEKFFELGKYFEDRKQFGQAAVEYQKALDEDPTFFEAQHHLGRAYRGANMLDQAEAALNQAFKLNPKSAEARIDLAEIYFSQDKHDLARDLAQKALELSPGNPGAYTLLGGILLQEKKYKEAAEKFEKALLQDPKNAEVHYALAFAYLFDASQDRKQDAIKELHQAGELGYPIQKARDRFAQELKAQGSSLEQLEKEFQATQPKPEPAEAASPPPQKKP